jgi:hypothetical protein
MTIGDQGHHSASLKGLATIRPERVGMLNGATPIDRDSGCGQFRILQFENQVSAQIHMRLRKAFTMNEPARKVLGDLLPYLE